MHDTAPARVAAASLRIEAARWRRWFRPTAAALGLVLGACHASDVRTLPDLPEPSDASRTDAARRAPDADASAAGDDAGPSPAAITAILRAAQRFQDDWAKTRLERVVACFNYSARAEGAEFLPLSLPLEAEQAAAAGAVRFDDVAAAACLGRLRAMSCEALAVAVQRETDAPDLLGAGCPPVLVGLRAAQARCHVSAECAPGLRCERHDASCGGRCGPPRPAAAGASCDDGTRCGDGLRCAGPDGSRTCGPPLPAGAPCDHDDPASCGPSLFCGPDGPDAPVHRCRPAEPGATCDGGWQCAPPYVCLGPTATRPGSCGVGRPDGAPCAPFGHDVRGYEASDCAPDLVCVDRGAGFHCSSGAQLGETCGELAQPGGETALLDCAGDSCEGAIGVGTCQPRAASVPTCDFDAQCDPPDVCELGADGTQACRRPPAPLPVGASCRFNSPRPPCEEGAHCTPDYPPGTPPPPNLSLVRGVCRRFGAAGERCGEDFPCGEWLTCRDGFCDACP